MAVERGQIWQLGRHRLMCGDATSREDVEKLMDGKKATLCFTDPPYGVKKEREGVLNDNLNQTKLTEFNKAWIPASFDALTEIGSWYCWGCDESVLDIYSEILRPLILSKDISLRNLITWDKGVGMNQMAKTMRSYPFADEKCLFVMKGKQATWSYSTNADNYYEGWEPIRSYLDGERVKMGWDPKDIKRITGVGMFGHWFTKSQFCLPTRERYAMLQEAARGDAFKKEYDAIKKEYDAIKKEYDENCRAYFNNTHDNMNNVWHFERAKAEERFHPTTKPIALCSRAIKSSSREGDIVLDVFGGGGSTLIACERLDRTCYMMELSPNWVQVIIDRWEAETDKKATLIP